MNEEKSRFNRCLSQLRHATTSILSQLVIKKCFWKTLINRPAKKNSSDFLPVTFVFFKIFSYWIDDIICECCGNGDNEKILLLCDGCDKAYHTYCVSLGENIPQTDWYCNDCISRRRQYLNHSSLITFASNSNTSTINRQTRKIRKKATRHYNNVSSLLNLPSTNTRIIPMDVDSNSDSENSNNNYSSDSEFEMDENEKKYFINLRPTMMTRNRLQTLKSIAYNKSIQARKKVRQNIVINSLQSFIWKFF